MNREAPKYERTFVTTAITIQTLEDEGFLPHIHEQARSEYPRECCGLIISGESGLELVPCKNLQDEMRERDPERFPRTSATGYYIDPKVIMDHASQLRCVYHSHPDHGAYFSDEDQMAAAPFGEPSFANTHYLVVSIIAGDIAENNLYAWDEHTGQFELAKETA